MLTEKDLEEIIERLEKSNRIGKETALKVYKEMLDGLRKDPQMFKNYLLEMLEEYDKDHPEKITDRNSKASIAIMKFNEMLQDPGCSNEDAWKFLEDAKLALEKEFYDDHGFYMNMDYMFLYPQIITSKEN